MYLKVEILSSLKAEKTLFTEEQIISKNLVKEDSNFEN